MTLHWTDWPAPRQPARSVLALILIVIVALVTASVDVWLGVVGAVMLVVSTSEALLPTRYEIGPEGISVRRPFTRRTQGWSRFTGFRQTDDGFVVLGEGSRAFLRRHRTMVLANPPDPAAVATALGSHLGAACAR